MSFCHSVASGLGIEVNSLISMLGIDRFDTLEQLFRDKSDYLSQISAMESIIEFWEDLKKAADEQKLLDNNADLRAQWTEIASLHRRLTKMTVQASSLWTLSRNKMNTLVKMVGIDTLPDLDQRSKDVFSRSKAIRSILESLKYVMNSSYRV